MKVLPKKMFCKIQKRPVELIAIFIFMYSLFSLPSIAYSALEGPGAGLVGWWEFEEGTGNTVFDSSGNGNTGTIIGTPSWTSGVSGGGLDLTGTTYIRIPTSPSLSGTSVKTIAVWANLSDFIKISSSFFGWGRNGCQDNYRGWVNSNGSAQASYQNTTGETVVRPGYLIAPRGTGKLGEWAHYAFVYNVSGTTVTISLYKNGVLAGTPYIGGDGLSDCGSLTAIGSQEDLPNPNYVRTFSGIMDDFRVYDRPLSASEISELYNQGRFLSSDTTPPATPTGLTATAVSSYKINLNWNPSSDNVGVAGYVIYRGGVPMATVRSGTGYSDVSHTITTLYAYTVLPSTNYTYTVAAFDAAGNYSTPSGTASATTLSASPGLTYTLLVSIAGTGLSTVSSSPAGLTCSSGTCSASFNAGTTVNLTPYPFILGMKDSTPAFAGWSGSGCSGNGECILLMDSNKTATATYGFSSPVEPPPEPTPEPTIEPPSNLRILD